MIEIFDLFEKIFARLKKPFYQKIYGITNNYRGLNKRCLVYYKTEPFYRKKFRNFKKHTNGWEVFEIVKILNRFGYIVDIIDREVNDFTPEDKYDLFFSNASGNSGKHFEKYARKLKKSVKILYLTGPEPSISNSLVKERYDNFKKRTKIHADYMRVTDINFEKFIKYADYLLCIGEKDQFSVNTYKKYHKPIFSILPSSSPSLSFSNESYKLRDRKHFLYLAGSGLICKGVDLAIEAFLSTPDLVLHICGPAEDGIDKAYRNKFNNSSNIHYYGFVDIHGKIMRKLVNLCSFSLLHSASEGCATSLTTTMRLGLPPIANYEAGMNIHETGLIIENNDQNIENIKNICQFASRMSSSDYNKLVKKTLLKSEIFTCKSFTKSIQNALEYINKDISSNSH